MAENYLSIAYSIETKYYYRTKLKTDDDESANQLQSPVVCKEGETKTRKLSCRKDDHAMRPMYGCPENFRESLTTFMATFLKIFNGLSFRFSL